MRFVIPAIELPVGFGQTRKPTQLPVLTMICAYSRWLMAVLLPSRRAEDLFAGWWQLIGACPELRGFWGDDPWWTLGGGTDAFGAGVGMSLESGDELGHLLVALDAAE